MRGFNVYLLLGVLLLGGCGVSKTQSSLSEPNYEVQGSFESFSCNGLVDQVKAGENWKFVLRGFVIKKNQGSEFSPITITEIRLIVSKVNESGEKLETFREVKKVAVELFGESATVHFPATEFSLEERVFNEGSKFELELTDGTTVWLMEIRNRTHVGIKPEP